jgi:NADPH-dependent glutamate synthase beta subunit-like oxidoreductase
MEDYNGPFLTEAQLRYEIRKCENCEAKPCLDACPAGVSPMDFILAARVGLPSDYRRAAARIMTANPLGGICGITCPDTLCMQACVYRRMNSPVNIPACQATIVHRAKSMGVMPVLAKPSGNGRRVAVVGAGPAGLAAAAALAGQGYTVTVFEKSVKPGGMCLSIPQSRLPRDIMESDIAWLLASGDITLKTETRIMDPEDLIGQGFDAVAVCAGLEIPLGLGIDNENLAVPGLRYL